MTVDDRIFAAFKQYCRANGMKVSSRVEIMLRDFIMNTPQEPERPNSGADVAQEQETKRKRGGSS